MRAVIVESNPIIREGLCSILAGSPIEVVGVYATIAEAAAEVEAVAADVAFLEARAAMRDLRFLQQIRQAAPKMGIVLLDMFDDADRLLEAIRCGASCYLCRDISLRSLLIAAEAAAAGFIMAEGAAMRTACTHFLQGQPLSSGALEAELTERERQVLRLISQGLSNSRIAEELVITVGTVRSHVSNILTKLNVRDRVQAAVWAAERGLCEDLPSTAVGERENDAALIPGPRPEGAHRR